MKAALEGGGILENVSGKQLALRKEVATELLEAESDDFKAQLKLDIQTDFEKQKLDTTLLAKPPTTPAEFQQ